MFSNYLFISFQFCILLIFIIHIKLTSPYQFLDCAVIKDLVVNEAKLLNTIQDHIVEEQAKLNTLKLKVTEFQELNSEANEVINYFLNPLSAFSFTRRIVVDWKEIEKYFTNTKFLGSLQSFKNLTNFPTRNILDNVATAFLNLQNFYDLETSSISIGELNGIYYNTSMTVRDCVELGSVAYSKSNFYNAIKWLEEALLQIQDKDEIETEMIENILRTLSKSYSAIGDIQSALEMIQHLLIIKPDDLNAINDEEMFNRLIEIDSTILEANRNEYLDEVRPRSEEFDEYKIDEYEELCRHDFKRSSKILRSLNCRYIDNNNKFLIIGPFKQEILSLEPLVCIYHDVLYDEEIEMIKDAVGTNFVDAAEFDFETKKYILSQRRTSKLGSYKNTDSSIFNVLEQRTGIMTGFIMKPNEGLSIQKYEIGGKYVPHFDYLQVDSNLEYQRIATVIYYMNDVEQGGDTVFPEIGVNVPAIKGSALFWYNTHSSGDLDIRSLHAGCPVLVGTKLIGTYFIREKPQLFIRPCINSSRGGEEEEEEDNVL